MAWSRLSLAIVASAAIGACGNSPAPAQVIVIDDPDILDGATPQTVSDAVDDAKGANDVSLTDVPDVAEVMTQPDASADAARRVACDTPMGKLPGGVTTIFYDDDTPVGTVAGQTWTIVNAPIATTHLYEAVRFDLTRPAKVWGFSVKWGTLPANQNTAVKAGLYPDFGHNGFDFWRFDPLWQGSLCAGDLTAGAWVDYVFDAPVVIAHPGFVYVAHDREGEDAPAWSFDGTSPANCKDPQKCCDDLVSCHGAWNFPDLTQFTSGGQTNFAWNGLSTSFQYDYLVRLHVAYTDDVKPQDKVFQPVANVKPGSRSAFADFDNDGDEDLLGPGPALWRNEGGGAFTDITKGSGLEGLAGSGGVWGDFDNDGCVDLFLFSESYAQGDALAKGDCKGGFADVTQSAGVVDFQEYNTCKKKGNMSPTPAATWVDVDGDGLLDLYLANFLCWDDYTAYADTVWHNTGGGAFEDWTGTHGFLGPKETRTPSRGVSAIDMDQDGDVDIWVNNYVLVANLFYRNEGGGAFVEMGKKNGLAGKPTTWSGATYYGHSIGTAWGDLNGDGHFDAVVANLAHPRFFNFSNKTQILIHDGKGQFKDTQGDWKTPQGAAGLRYQETHSVPVLADFDLNGTLDLAISAVYPARPTDFYWGKGDGTFTLDGYHAGIDVENGWGMAVADIDNDGAPDLAAQNVLYRNALPSGNKGHWLQIRVVGDGKSNRAGIGAVARVTAGGKVVVRSVGGGSGQGCQDALTLYVGLGEATKVDSVEVRFVGGGVHTFGGPFDAGERLWLYESGKVVAGWKGG